MFLLSGSFKLLLWLSVLKVHDNISVGLFIHFAIVMGTWWPFQSGNSYFFNSNNVYWIFSLTIPLSLVSFSLWNPYYMDLLGYFSNFFVFSLLDIHLFVFLFCSEEVSSSLQLFYYGFHFCHHIFNFQQLFFLWILLFIPHSVLFSGLQYLLSLWICTENFLPPSASVLQVFFCPHSLFPPCCLFLHIWLLFGLSY